MGPHVHLIIQLNYCTAAVTGTKKGLQKARYRSCNSTLLDASCFFLHLVTIGTSSCLFVFRIVFNQTSFSTDWQGNSNIHDVFKYNPKFGGMSSKQVRYTKYKAVCIVVCEVMPTHYSLGTLSHPLAIWQYIT